MKILIRAINQSFDEQLLEIETRRNLRTPKRKRGKNLLAVNAMRAWMLGYHGFYRIPEEGIRKENGHV